MINTKVIEVLLDLKNYVNENWDESEYKKEMDESSEAVDIAVVLLKERKFIGTMDLNGETYGITKID